MSYVPKGQICPAELLADCLRSLKGTAKEIASRLQCSPDSVKNWRTRGNTMSADKLIRAMAEYDEVFEAVCAMAGREPGVMSAAQFAEELTRRLKQAGQC